MSQFWGNEDRNKKCQNHVYEYISKIEKIVQEGIEKKEQVDFLAKCGCDMIQGYYFAKPMPASDYETRMNEKE